MSSKSECFFFHKGKEVLDRCSPVVSFPVTPVGTKTFAVSFPFPSSTHRHQLDATSKNLMKLDLAFPPLYCNIQLHQNTLICRVVNLSQGMRNLSSEICMRMKQQKTLRELFNIKRALSRILKVKYCNYNQDFPARIYGAYECRRAMQLSKLK